MNITIQRKTLGRSRKIEPVQYTLPRTPQTLRELLHMLVTLEIDRYEHAHTVTQFVTEAQQKEAQAYGALKFSAVTPHVQQSRETSISIMEQAFEDGLFKVVQQQHVYTALDEPLHSQAEQWTFIKLTFLAGT